MICTKTIVIYIYIIINMETHAEIDDRASNGSMFDNKLPTVGNQQWANCRNANAESFSLHSLVPRLVPDTVLTVYQHWEKTFYRKNEKKKTKNKIMLPALEELTTDSVLVHRYLSVANS